MQSRESQCHRILTGPPYEMTIPNESLGKLLFDQIKSTDGNKTAMINVSTGVSITYGDILKKSVALAKYLSAHDFKKGDVVSIICENSVYYCIPFLASLYLGITVNPLNPGYSKGELKRAFNISLPKIIFVSKTSLENVISVYEEIPSIKSIIVFGESLPFTDIKTSKMCFNEEDENIDGFLPTRVNPNEDIAYILLSSGTSGFPKGVMHTHRSGQYTFVVLRLPEYTTYKSDAVVLIIIPCYLLMGMLLQMINLYYGTLAIIMDRFKPTLLLESIQTYKVSFLCVVPTIMSFFSNSPLLDKYDLSSVKHIAWSADSMSTDIEINVQKRFSLEWLHQVYGTTETGMAILSQIKVDKVGSCGSLMPGAEGKVCDPENGVTLGPNQVGELRFKAPSLMKGYTNPEATDAAFDEDGFWMSGDAGYYDEEGDFYIIDRLKDLIKYKGFQVSPAEVEAVLLTHPAVKEVCVVGKPDERAGQLPIAFIVKQEAKHVSEKELIDLVANNLSVQKRLYGGVKFVKEIPKNSLGKCLRRDLREMAKTL